MAELESWSAADDTLVRGALATLRTDVDAVPLPDARFVRARGAQRRRRRTMTWAAASAAAAVAIGTVGMSLLGEHRPGPLVPSTRTTGTAIRTPSPTTTAPPTSSTSTSSLDQPGALPLPQEWVSALRVTGRPRLTVLRKSSPDWGNHECLVTIPVGQVERQQVTVDGLRFEGGETRFAVPTSLDPRTVAEGVTSDIAACQAGPRFTVTPQSEGWPRLFSYKAGEAGSGWFAVVPGPADLTLIQVVDPAHSTSVFTQAQVLRLADIAEGRLKRYGSAATASPSGSGTTGSPASTPAKDEDMPVSGVAPLLPSRLFVAASQWTSPLFAHGAKATAGPGALEGSSAIVPCETDEQQAGVGGRYGIVNIRAGQGPANYIGKQRVRLFEDVQGYELAQADLKRLDRLVMAGCGSAGGPRTTAQRGPLDGTYLLTTKSAESTGATSYAYVGATGQQTEGAVSTVVFWGSSDGQGFQGTKAQGFAELTRLLDLARQQ